MVVLTNQVRCVIPYSSPTRGYWPQCLFLTFQYNFTRIICIQRFAIWGWFLWNLTELADSLPLGRALGTRVMSQTISWVSQKRLSSEVGISLLRHFRPASGGSDKSGQVCHTTRVSCMKCWKHTRVPCFARQTCDTGVQFTGEFSLEHSQITLTISKKLRTCKLLALPKMPKAWIECWFFW